MKEETINPEVKKAEEELPSTVETAKQIINEADTIRKMEEATRKLDVANAEFKANKAIADAAKVERTLQGQSESGIPKKKETPKEYKDRIMRGEFDGG